MPYDLLSNIANRLKLIDFTCFHLVCNDWRYATEPLLEIKGCGRDRWFLSYDKRAHCSMVKDKGKVYSIKILELGEDKSTRLASYGGWLLVFRDSSLFFLCPFSRAKIQLPNCPIKGSNGCVAAFSSAPTSQDCIVAMINRVNDFKLELHTLCWGDNTWAKHKVSLKEDPFFCFKKYAFFIEGKFIYGNEKHVVIFEAAANSKLWSKGSLLTFQDPVNDESTLKCRLKDFFVKKGK